MARHQRGSRPPRCPTAGDCQQRRAPRPAGWASHLCDLLTAARGERGAGRSLSRGDPRIFRLSHRACLARDDRRRRTGRRSLSQAHSGAPRHRRVLCRHFRTRAMSDRILILDFGSQVTQLIARRVRESGVYCEIHPYTIAEDTLRDFGPDAVILSGGPASLTRSEAPRAPELVFRLGVPVLGICYGMQTMCAQLGGRVTLSEHQEFGRAFIDVLGECALFDGLWPKGARGGGREQVWMSHGDRVDALPSCFRAVAASEAAPYAAIADDERRFYGVLFHPEVVHTPQGGLLLRNFTDRVAGCHGDWTMALFGAQAIDKIRRQVGTGGVVCGLSGGVDSAVVAALLHEAIGDQLTCIFVDTGLLRAREAEEVVDLFRRHYNIPLVHRDASDLFLAQLAGVSDPEDKRKTIGATFIDVFDEEAHELGNVEFL